MQLTTHTSVSSASITIAANMNADRVECSRKPGNGVEQISCGEGKEQALLAYPDSSRQSHDGLNPTQSKSAQLDEKYVKKALGFLHETTILTLAYMARRARDVPEGCVDVVLPRCSDEDDKTDSDDDSDSVTDSDDLDNEAEGDCDCDEENDSEDESEIDGESDRDDHESAKESDGDDESTSQEASDPDSHHNS